MSENEMPERIWIEGPCVVTNDPSDQKYYVHEDKYDYLTDDYLTEYRRIPSLPDVMEDGDTVWRVGSAFIRVEIHNGEFPAYEFTNDHGRRPLTITSELAEFLGLPTLKLQNNQIVKVEG